MKLVIKVWKETLGILLKNRIIILPFVIVGLFDVISLILIYLAPQAPFSAVLAPPIRAFWGERFLHYPLNLLLIPRLFGYAHILTIAVMGVAMTGLVVGMLGDLKKGNHPKVATNLIYALSRYFTILLIWLIMFILGGLIYKIPRLIAPHSSRLVIQIALILSFMIVILIQIAFIYAIPAALIERKNLIPAIKRGACFSKRYFLTTLALVLIPSLLYIPILILKGKTALLMSRTFPEITLIIIVLGIIVSVIIDCIVTCSTAVLFLNQEKAS